MLMAVLVLPMVTAIAPQTTSLHPPRVAAQEAFNKLTSERVSGSAPDDMVLFVENMGQFPEEVLYSVMGENQTTWITANGIWITYLDPSRSDGLSSEPLNGIHIKLSFLDAMPNPGVRGLQRAPTKVSYFRGNEKTRWFRVLQMV